MKHTLTAVTLMISLALAGGARAATYGWSGGGGNNLWSNGNNWTNVADSSTGVAPGAADDARFADGENDVVALTADATINRLVLGHGGMSITGAFTLRLNAATEPLTFGATYFGGSATVSCNINMPNMVGTQTANGTRISNWNQTLTLNGNVNTPNSGTPGQVEINGNGSAKLIINGQ